MTNFDKNIDNSNNETSTIENGGEHALCAGEAVSASSPRIMLVDPGTYQFTVLSTRQDRFNGSAKMEPCPMQRIDIRLEGAGGMVLHESILLHTKLAWKIAEFFVSLGLVKKGDDFVPDWDVVVGMSGMAEIGVNTFLGRDGQQHTTNRVVRYIAAETETAPLAAAPSVVVPSAVAASEAGEPQAPGIRIRRA